MHEKIAATLAGNVIPPRIRAPEREIPAAVEAVIMKAMSLDPANRYQSVRELRNEVNAYINGYATAAEKASIFKKTILFLKRHRILTAMLCLCLFLAFLGTGYVVRIQQRSLMEWKCLVNLTFDKEKKTENYQIIDLKGNRKKPRLTAGKTIVLTTGEWFRLDRGLDGNVKLELHFNAGVPVRCMEIVFSSTEKQPDAASSDGYMIRLADHGRDWIYRISAGAAPVPLASSRTFLHGDDNHICIRFQNGTLIMEDVHGDMTHLQISDPVQNHRIPYSFWLRSLSGPVEISGFKLYVQILPENPMPLVKGMILEEAGEYQKAYRQYLMVEKLYPNDYVSNQALVRAFRIAVFQLADPAKMDEVRMLIRRRPDFSLYGVIRKMEALSLWKDGKWEDAIRMADLVLADDPRSNVLQQFLLFPHRELPPESARKLMTRLGRMNHIEWLDVSGLGIDSLEPLSHLPLVWLNCSGNRIRNIDVTENMPLQYLDCRQNPGLDTRIENFPSIFLCDGQNDGKMTVK